MRKRLIQIAIFCVLPAIPASAFTRVQRVAFNSSTGSAFAVTIASTGSGNLIVVEQAFYKAGTCVASVTAPTDNKGGGSSTYHADIAPVNPDTNGSMCLAIYSTANSASGITSVTVNSTATGNAGFIEEWSGVATSSPLDKTSSGHGVTNPWSTGATATLTGSIDLAIGVAMCGDWYRTNTPVSPFGSGAGSIAGTLIVAFTENATLAATTGIAATGNFDSADGYNAVIATYQAVSAAVIRHRASVIQ